MPQRAQSKPAEAADVERRRRDPLRRERILMAAAELFGSRGFDRTGLSDIGAAAGITGPAVYRHFANKEEILVALFERLIERLQRETLALMQRELSPRARLEGLIAVALDATSADRPVMDLTPRDLQTLSPAARARIAAEQGKLRTSWIDLLRDARPELSERDARAMILAIHGLITSVGTSADIPERRLDAILTSMLKAALFADVDPTPGAA